jgi:hypothetical protein
MFFLRSGLMYSKWHRRNFICAAPGLCLSLCFRIQFSLLFVRAACYVVLCNLSGVSLYIYFPKLCLIIPFILLCVYILNSIYLL